VAAAAFPFAAAFSYPGSMSFSFLLCFSLDKLQGDYVSAIADYVLWLSYLDVVDFLARFVYSACCCCCCLPLHFFYLVGCVSDPVGGFFNLFL
jgi:hypothetical protein